MKSMPRWGRIGLYYLIALAGSYIYRVHWQFLPWPRTGDTAWSLWRGLLQGFGPLLGALLVVALFRPVRLLGLFGPYRSIVAGLAIWVVGVMALVGVSNPFGIGEHLFGAIAGLNIIIYGVFEETGWRGYLQGELSGWSSLLRYSVVGVFWYAWHLTYLDHHRFADELFTLGMLVAASIGIGLVADRTQSILAAACCHILGNILGLSAELKALVPSDHRQLMATACAIGVALMIIMVRVQRNGRTLSADN